MGDSLKESDVQFTFDQSADYDKVTITAEYQGFSVSSTHCYTASAAELEAAKAELFVRIKHKLALKLPPKGAALAAVAEKIDWKVWEAVDPGDFLVHGSIYADGHKHAASIVVHDADEVPFAKDEITKQLDKKLGIAKKIDDQHVAANALLPQLVPPKLQPVQTHAKIIDALGYQREIIVPLPLPKTWKVPAVWKLPPMPKFVATEEFTAPSVPVLTFALDPNTKDHTVPVYYERKG